MPDWLNDSWRVLTVLGLASGVYRGFRELRRGGPAPYVVHTINTIVLLVYTVAATMLIAAYFLFAWPDHLVLFALAAVVYVVGGYRLINWILARVHRRFGGRPTF
jgi:drug/metabolite transporter superfamily protein YnfA